jgi:hypothetical protein
MRLAALLLACGACSGLEQLPGTCGDGVVDRGEDCDSGPNCTPTCSIDCSGGRECPEGYACGADRLCHSPGGHFATTGPTAVQPFSVLGFGFTDTDSDGYNDVVGLTHSSFQVLYGDAAGTLGRTSTAVIPPIGGPPAVARIDGDASLDLVIPAGDGLIAYTEPYGVISPYPFAIEIDASPQMTFPITIASLDRNYLAAVVDDRMTNQVGIAIIDATKKNPSDAFTLIGDVCPGIAPSALDAKLVDHYDLADPVAPSHVIALATATGAVCTVELRDTVTAPGFAIANTRKPGALVPGQRPILAHLQPSAATPCPSIVSVAGMGLSELAASGAIGGCTFAGTRTLPAYGPLIGRVAYSPAPAAMATDALAFTTTIVAYDSTTGAPTTIYQAFRPMDTIASLDVDGDGDLDAVASATTYGFGDLDVLYRYGKGTAQDPAGFLDVELGTAQLPHDLLTGDFDGDGIGDITYTEALAKGERLMIAYGTRDHVLPPQFVSTFNDVELTRVLHLQNSADPTGTRVDDLIVMDSPPSSFDPQSAQLLTVLFGNPARVMLPFLDPRTAGGPPTVFTGAVVGTFGPVVGNYHDLFAIETPQVPDVATNLWRLAATELGAMKADPPVTSTDIVTCSTPKDATSITGFCGSSSPHFLPYQHDASAPPGTPDLVLGFDKSAAYQVIAIDPQRLDAPPALISLASAGLLEPDLSFRQNYVADVDGDGVVEVVTGYGPGDDTMPSTDGRGHVVTCTFDGTFACKLLPLPDTLADYACIDAAPARIVEHQFFDSLPGKSQDLAVMCRKDGSAELFRVYYDHDDHDALKATPLLSLPVETRYVQVADVTGDGVDDVLAFEDEGNGVTVLAVYPQCTSRDLECLGPRP